MKTYLAAVERTITSKQASRISAVICNQSCDPDSVIGSVLASIILTLQSPSNEGLSTSWLNDFLSHAPVHLGELYLPIWPSHSWERVLAKDDINHLDTTFGLELSQLLNIQVQAKNLLQTAGLVEQVLYDHNAPEEIMRSWAKEGLKPSGIIDHHALVAGALESKSLRSIHLEPSASAVSVLWRLSTQHNTKVVLGKHFAKLLQSASVILEYDSFGFSAEGKNNRWWTKDKEAANEICQFGGLEETARIEHTRSLMEAQFSDNQFKESLSDLLSRDAKTFGYSLREPIEAEQQNLNIFYATLSNTASKYSAHFAAAEFALQIEHKLKSNSAVVFMFVCAKQTQTSRELLVCTHSAALAQRLFAALSSCGQPVTEPAVADNPFAAVAAQLSTVSIRFYANPSCTISRKILEKAVRNTLE